MRENTGQDERREACEMGSGRRNKGRNVGRGYQGPDVGS